MNKELFENLINEHRNQLPRAFNQDFIEHLDHIGYFTAPASKKYHGNHEGGLFKHSYEVTKTLLEFTENLNIEWEHPRSPIVVGMFHDLCKADNYEKVITDEGVLYFGKEESEGEEYHYINAPKGMYQGHGEKSVLMLAQWLQLTEEEILCIRYHMGAYERDDWDCFDKAIRKYETVLWTHTADNFVSKGRKSNW